MTNKKLLLKAKKAILQSPEEFDWEDQFECCIAGFILRVAGRNPERITDPHEAALRVSGLSREQAHELFNVPANYNYEPTTRLQFERNARLAARCIDRVLARALKAGIDSKSD